MNVKYLVLKKGMYLWQLSFVLFIFLLTFLTESLRLPLEKQLFGTKGMKKLEENCGSVLDRLYGLAGSVIRRLFS